MRVRMKAYISGTRDGQDWPARGEILEVSDEEGANLCAAGLAVPVADKDAKVEKTVAKASVESRDETPVPRRRGRPPGTKNKPKTDEG